MHPTSRLTGPTPCLSPLLQCSFDHECSCRLHSLLSAAHPVMTSNYSLRSPTRTSPNPRMPQTIAPAIAHATSIPTNASYTIAVALPQDIPYLTTIQWAALTSNPLIKTLYPHGPTPALTAFTRNSYTKALLFPSVRIIKATDIERGEIVAFAKWIKYPEEIPEPLECEGGRIQSVGQAGGGGWSKGNIPSQKPDDVDKRALGDWNGVITQMRRGIMKNRRHTCRAKPDPCSLECYFASIAPALWGESSQRAENKITSWDANQWHTNSTRYPPHAPVAPRPRRWRPTGEMGHRSRRQRRPAVLSRVLPSRLSALQKK